MIYLISRDNQIEVEEKEFELRSKVLLQNPEIYDSVFGNESEDLPEGFEVEEVVPETMEDVDNLLLDLKREGIIK